MKDKPLKVPTMTELGKLNSADKVEHGYTFLYDQIFEPIRYRSVRILEIGFSRGRGARLLSEFFPRGIIHSFDIDPNYQAYSLIPPELQKRIKLWHADQSNKDSINLMLQLIYNSNKNKAKRGPRKFDIIIDDGSHQPEHQQASFDILWSEVSNGGLYIIEDFHPYYENDPVQHKTVSWLFDKVHKLNKNGDKKADPILPDIDWILFSYNQAVIRKKV
jgi:hypothetical protein